MDLVDYVIKAFLFTKRNAKKSETRSKYEYKTALRIYCRREYTFYSKQFLKTTANPPARRLKINTLISANQVLFRTIN
jgi:hypothetical protein